MGRARKLVSATVLCLAIAGCGGSDHTTVAFKSGYEQASQPIETTGADIAQALKDASHQTDARIASAFGDLANRFDGELIQLEALKPPASVSSAFVKLTAAANRLDTDLRAISVGASHHEASAAKAGLQAIIADGGAMNSAAATVRQELGIK
jgi:hypothetical protein